MRTKCQFIWKFYKITLWSSWQFHLNYNNSSISTGTHTHRERNREQEMENEWIVVGLLRYCPSGAFARFCCWTLYSNHNRKLDVLACFCAHLFSVLLSKLLRMEAECSLFCLLLRLNKRFLAQRTNKSEREEKNTHNFMMFVARKFYENFKLVN